MEDSVRNSIPVSRLVELLRYDHENGELYWKERPGNKRFNTKYANKKAFTAKQSAGYPHSSVDGVFLLAHRVAWAIYNGRWPENQIDHINGDRSDFRIENLREADQSENLMNARMSNRNSSGTVGVSFNRATRRWVAYVCARGRHRHIGSYKCKTAAAVARRAAEVEFGFHRNHGRVV